MGCVRVDKLALERRLCMMANGLLVGNCGHVYALWETFKAGGPSADADVQGMTLRHWYTVGYQENARYGFAAAPRENPWQRCVARCER